MEFRTGKRSVVKKFAVILAYFFLLFTEAITSDRTNKSNVPSTETVYRRKSPSKENDSSYKTAQYRECLVCGRANIERVEETIIKGDKVQPPNKYPWMVRLRFRSVDESGACGGAILGKYYILTAAHCAAKTKNSRSCGTKKTHEICTYEPNEIKIGLLSRNPKVLEPGPPVKQVFVHPKYHIGYKHDIAILELKKPIICSEFASPICLPSANFFVPKKIMFGVSGWGATRTPEMGKPKKGLKRRDRNSDSRVLLESIVKLIEPQTCAPDKRMLRSYCVTGINGKSPCYGDSGGPIFLQKSNAFYVAGVASAHTSELCDANKPLIYTKVASYMRWIKKKTRLGSVRPVRPGGHHSMRECKNGTHNCRSTYCEESHVQET